MTPNPVVGCQGWSGPPRNQPATGTARSSSSDIRVVRTTSAGPSTPIATSSAPSADGGSHGSRLSWSDGSSSATHQGAARRSGPRCRAGGIPAAGRPPGGRSPGSRNGGSRCHLRGRRRSTRSRTRPGRRPRRERRRSRRRGRPGGGTNRLDDRHGNADPADPITDFIGLSGGEPLARRLSLEQPRGSAVAAAGYAAATSPSHRRPPARSVPRRGRSIGDPWGSGTLSACQPAPSGDDPGGHPPHALRVVRRGCVARDDETARNTRDPRRSPGSASRSARARPSTSPASDDRNAVGDRRRSGP